MWSFADIRPAYSRAERVSDGVVHLLGLTAAVVAVPILIVLTALYRSESAAVVGASVYGVTLILMLTFSALYNMVQSEKWADLLRKLDHSGIYVKIAGTYTPFILLSGAQMPGLMIGLWSSATLGSILKMVDPHRFRWLGLALYVLMGWAAIWAGQSLLADLSQPVVVLMITGGIVYTVGIAFYLLDWLPFHNTIWHVFVLTGSVLFFLAVSFRIAWAPVLQI
ncbi:hemolysin III family protein [Ruegeria sp. Ofav3-42]|uniref:PAQR family membrane homeostasis protein TrhA n=1 Tax=Ruegeria sp. Ofav3-42 TaxID=2917759 RepID=UPI001EF5F9B9|nr:hemolysin III family protein [Ruegeria sp. Ofav3-42]MCG7521200.1 hemolysin III family protein [Ruegeria sp. Ofav3-42]